MNIKRIETINEMMLISQYGDKKGIFFEKWGCTEGGDVDGEPGVGWFSAGIDGFGSIVLVEPSDAQSVRKVNPDVFDWNEIRLQPMNKI